jgi:hypothetical protein
MGYTVTVTLCVMFQFQTMFNTIVGAVAVRVGAASRYSSTSDQMMQLLPAPAPQHEFTNSLANLQL